MKVLFASAEAAPYFKSGGLADVSRALPDALVANGVDVRIIHPLYNADDPGFTAAATEEALIRWPTGEVHVSYLLHEVNGGAPGVLVDQPAFFAGGMPYTPTPEEPSHAGIRFAFFSRAVVAYAREWGADIVHLNDWPTGLVPVYSLLDGMHAATVFAIHNLAYQGNFSPMLLGQIGIPEGLFRVENGVEFYGSLSFMKGALALSDRLVTVSPTYAREIQTPEYGAGMDGLLRFRRRVLHGILNGIDREVWNPTSDRSLVATYSARTPGGKLENRDALLAELGLDGDGPVFGMVTRLAHQKGIDLVVGALPGLLQLGARLVVLGDGDASYARTLAEAAARAPDRIAVRFGFDDAFARRLYAGGDFFLMPSRYEPCGLGQMIAQRYGTPPIVRHTGGLVDTVHDGRTGFIFDHATSGALLAAAERAIKAWRHRGWDTLERRCMRLDWSWERSAAQYHDVYRLAAGRIDDD
ncbi:MAG: glycogen synthase [Longimicrobiales bacterium]